MIQAAKGLHLAIYVVDITKSRLQLGDVEGLKMIDRILEAKPEHNNTYVILNQIDRLSESLQAQTIATYKRDFTSILS